MAQLLNNMANGVSYEEIARAISVSSRRCKKVVWHTINIEIKHSLNAQEYIDTYHNIIKNCTSKDGDCFLPLVDFSIRINVIAAYTNVDLPTDIDRLFDVAYLSDIYEVVCKNANKSQIEALSKSVWNGFGIGEE